MRTNQLLLCILISFVALVLMGTGLVLVWGVPNFVEGRAVALVTFLGSIYFFTRYIFIYFVKGHRPVVKSKIAALKKIIKYDQFLLLTITGSTLQPKRIFMEANPHGIDNDLMQWMINNAHTAISAETAGNHAMNIMKGGAGEKPQDPNNN